MTTVLSHRRVIIVGSGQSGLAVAAALNAEGFRPQQDYVVIDAAPSAHRSWSTRWHSMELLSDVRHSSMPSHPLPGDQRRRPRADEVADHFALVEDALGVRTAWRVRATGVERRGTGSTLLLSTSIGEVQTRNIVCATAAAAHARLPVWATKLTVPGAVLHSGAYLYPNQVPPGDVLVIGGGNSGVQIARELAASHAVSLSVRTPRRYRPVGSYPAAAGEGVSWVSRKRRPEPVFGESYDDLRRVGVTIVAAAAAGEGDMVTLADGHQMSPTSVIFATGYEPGDDWLPAEARVDGTARTQTGIPGLFVAGMPQYSGRGADTIIGVVRDATTIAHHIIDRP